MNARQVWVKAIVKDDSESSALLRHLEANGRAEHVSNDVTDEANIPVEVWIVDPDIVEVISTKKVADPEVIVCQRVELRQKYGVTVTLSFTNFDLIYVLNGLAALDKKLSDKQVRAMKNQKAGKKVRHRPSKIAFERADIKALHEQIKTQRTQAEARIKEQAERKGEADG